MEVSILNKISRANERFAQIGKPDYQQTEADTGVSIADATINALERYLARPDISPERRQAILGDQIGIRSAFAVMSEAVIELSGIVGCPRPELNIVPGLGPYGTAVFKSDNTAINIQELYFLEQAEKLRGTIKGQNDSAKLKLRNLIGHEMHHFKQEKHFPGAFVQTNIAVALKNEGDKSLYDKDRGESASNAFGDSYARYKMMHETNPERIPGLMQRSIRTL